MRMHQILLVSVATSGFVAGTAYAGDSAKSTIAVTSPSFGADQPIPREYTCEGAGESPPLAWSSVPSEAKSVALLVEDPDAPRGTFTHWIVANIPPNETSLSPGGQLPPGAVATNYRGPCPPTGTHHYRFHVFALDRVISPPHDRAEFLKAIDHHVVADGVLVGTYAKHAQ
jgi:Raf kinase inhibitor-like YbhB/YbcL family protein